MREGRGGTEGGTKGGRQRKVGASGEIRQLSEDAQFGLEGKGQELLAFGLRPRPLATVALGPVGGAGGVSVLVLPAPAMGAGSWALTLFGFSAFRVPGQPRSTWLGVVAALGLAAVALGTVAWRRARPRRRRRRLQQVGTVAQLWIYPIKSCKGVSVSEAECTAMGLRCGHLRDRYGEC